MALSYLLHSTLKAVDVFAFSVMKVNTSLNIGHLKMRL